MTQYTIMLVDDDVPFTELFGDSVPSEWKVRTFNNATAALKEVATIKPDLIISDIYMPEVHGLDFVGIAKTILSGIPILLISGNNKETVELEIGSIGIIPFFNKPLSDEFFDHIEKMLKTQNVETKTFQAVGEKTVFLERYHQSAKKFLEQESGYVEKYYSTNLFDHLKRHEERAYKKQKGEFSGFRECLGLTKEDDDRLWKEWRKRYSYFGGFKKNPQRILSKFPDSKIVEDRELSEVSLVTELVFDSPVDFSSRWLEVSMEMQLAKEKLNAIESIKVVFEKESFATKILLNGEVVKLGYGVIEGDDEEIKDLDRNSEKDRVDQILAHYSAFMLFWRYRNQPINPMVNHLNIVNASDDIGADAEADGPLSSLFKKMKNYLKIAG